MLTREQIEGLTVEETVKALAIAREIDRLETIAACEESFMEFVREYWPIVEPGRELKEGEAFYAIVQHLESVESGDISNLLINVPPGFSKSLLTSVFFPAWVWGPRNQASKRFLCFSYSESLTLRDNRRFSALILSDKYQAAWGKRVRVTKNNEGLIINSATGWKQASSVGGTGTGNRADCIIVDDGNNIQDAESEAVTESTLRWWREVVPTRMSDYESAWKIVIAQRAGANDISGDILDRGLPYEHLCLPMRFDPARRCETSIGFADWRTEAGELLFPERFSEDVVAQLEAEMGPYAVAAQFQQIPSPRGGGIILDEWWQVYDMAKAKKLGLIQQGGELLVYPPFDLVVCSVDTAYTEKQENDYSACTVWGVFSDEANNPRLMMIHAWRDRLKLHDLVERIHKTATKWKAEQLLIEAKASGLSVIQEVQRLYANAGFSIVPIDPKGDKVARLHSTVPLFASGLVYAPEKQWAQDVIDEVSAFPRGRFKDSCDTVSQALIHLRQIGIALKPSEKAEIDIDMATYRKPVPGLYEVC